MFAESGNRCANYSSRRRSVPLKVSDAMTSPPIPVSQEALSNGPFRTSPSCDQPLPQGRFRQCAGKLGQMMDPSLEKRLWNYHGWMCLHLFRS